MNNKLLRSGLAVFTIISLASLVACGGSSSSGGANPATSTTIEGTLSVASDNTRALGADDGGIADVTVSALGDSKTTDQYGNFTLNVDGNAFSGGPVLFSLSGNGVESSALFENVAGGPGVTAYVDMSLEDDGSISGTSTDSNGAVLSSISAKGALGCTENISFVDGSEGNLWKPISESTGTVVILMPSDYRNAEFSIHNSNGDTVAYVIKRSCCDHNGGRDHVYINRSASSLAGESLPLTVRYEFNANRVVCLEVANPTVRMD